MLKINENFHEIKICAAKLRISRKQKIISEKNKKNKKEKKEGEQLEDVRRSAQSTQWPVVTDVEV